MKASRVTREGVDRILAIGGIVIVLVQAAVLLDSRTVLPVILLGIVVNQLGAWGIARRLRPDRRVFLALRAEVDAFIGLVRRLNSQTIEGDARGVAETRDEMVRAVDRICLAAGVVGDTIPLQESEGDGAPSAGAAGPGEETREDEEHVEATAQG